LQASRAQFLHALPGKVSLGGLDLVDEYVLVVNNSAEEISLDGWKIRSSRGDQSFAFGSGLSLAARGGSIVVLSGPQQVQADAIAETAGKGVQHVAWSGRYLWNNEGDAAQVSTPAFCRWFCRWFGICCR
jgi:hypothetical protein